VWITSACARRQAREHALQDACGLKANLTPNPQKLPFEAENAVLRHQLIVLQRRVRGRTQATNNDRWFLVQMYRWFPSILKAVTIVQPETLMRWHRAGFRRYSRWKSNSQGGRPRIEMELRALIRQMSTENRLWGAPRIHGELLKLGFDVARSRPLTPAEASTLHLVPTCLKSGS
jgi:hypothetical protein